MNISPSAADAPDLDGIMSSAYGYALNDYIFKYGVAATSTPGEAFATGDEAYMACVRRVEELSTDPNFVGYYDIEKARKQELRI